MKGYVAAHLKDMNRQTVYKWFCELDETSKSELSRLTGISAPTIIKIINFLLEKELVQELGDGEAALGRKPQMLRLNKNRYYSIGVIHEGDFLKVGIANLRSEIEAMKKVKADGPLEQVLGETLFSLINELLVKSNIRLCDILGIGIGIPGIYHPEEHMLEMAPLIQVVNPVDISPILNRIQNAYQIPVFVENDLNMEVMGEFLSLRLPEESDLLYLSMGTGIGCGVMLGGQLRRGKHCQCGEIGYMTFMDDFSADVEKAGWLEQCINLTALREKFNISPDTPLSGRDRQVAIEYVSAYTALCINNLMMCYDCDHISLGGELFDVLGEDLFSAIKEKVDKISVGKSALHKSISPEPGITGAANTATQAAIMNLLQE